MRGQTSQFILDANLQRQLRANATDAERKLWQCLRARQLEGCKFRRQHPFGDYVLDFVCLERKVVAELDGGQHAETVAADARRTDVLERAGFRVLRFWNNEVFGEMDGVLTVIQEVLRERGGNPSPPQPSP